MNTKKWIVSGLFLIFLNACATTGMQTGTGKGWLYTELREPSLVTANQSGKRRGQACATNVLGLVSTGDASLAAAMKDGAITVVSSVDTYDKSIFIFWGKHCTIVTGN